MAKKQLIKLTESDLHTMIQEAVMEVLKEVKLTSFLVESPSASAMG